VIFRHLKTILYPNCFDANRGLFETILDAKNTIISDLLNHTSVIDGIMVSPLTACFYGLCDCRLNRQVSSVGYGKQLSYYCF